MWASCEVQSRGHSRQPGHRLPHAATLPREQIVHIAPCHELPELGALAGGGGRVGGHREIHGRGGGGAGVRRGRDFLRWNC